MSIVHRYISPTDGRVFTYGCRLPTPTDLAGARRFSTYFDAVALPVSPAPQSWLADAKPELDQMDLNDSEGDCVIAFGGHAEGIWTGWDGGPIVVPTKQQINAQYSAIGGYVLGDSSTDNGCDPITALNYWKAHGLPGGTPVGSWFTADGARESDLANLVRLFGIGMLCVALPDSALPENNPNLRNWSWWPFTGAPNPNNGHCVGAIAEDLKDARPSFLISTWGMWVRVDAAEIVNYLTPASGGSTYGMVSEAWMNKNTGKSPLGFNLAQLIKDSTLLG